MKKPTVSKLIASTLDLDLELKSPADLRCLEISPKQVPAVDFEPSWLVYVAVLCSQMSSLSMGCSFGWSAPALEDMAHWDQSPFRPTDSQASLIASILLIGAMFGGLCCGFLADYFGRKKTLIGLGIPYAAGWLLIGSSRSLLPILIGRILTGFSIGITTSVLPTYIAEISTPDTRGMIGMTFNFFIVGGTLYLDLVYIANFHWNQLAYWAAVPALLLSVSMLLMPESPTWIVNQTKDPVASIDTALNSLRQLRTAHSDIYQELDLLIESSRRVQQSSNSKLRFSWTTLTRADVYKPMLVGVALLFFQQFCGIDAVQFYANQIFEDSGSSLEPKFATVISNGGMLVATIIGGLIIDRFGRRILIMISAVGLTLSIGTLGIYYHQNPSLGVKTASPLPIAPSTLDFLNSSLAFVTVTIPSAPSTLDSLNFSLTTVSPSTLSSLNVSLSVTVSPSIVANHPESSSSLLPLICLTLYFCSFSLGIGPIVWIIITEITPPQTIGLILTTSSIICFVFTFVAVNEINHMFQWFSPQGTYWIFATVSAGSVIFAYFLPETKGKTMGEIVEIFNYER